LILDVLSIIKGHSKEGRVYRAVRAGIFYPAAFILVESFSVRDSN
jgi:hypothetical protein